MAGLHEGRPLQCSSGPFHSGCFAGLVSFTHPPCILTLSERCAAPAPPCPQCQYFKNVHSFVGSGQQYRLHDIEDLKVGRQGGAGPAGVGE